MNVIIFSLIIVTLLPFVAKTPLALAMKKHGGGNLGGYDNQHPRQQQKQLTGFGARCLAAHENSFEAIILFAPAALLVIATQNTNEFNANLAMAYVICRIAYLFCYWFNFDKLRSLVWIIGVLSSMTMMVSCLN
ncbi:MAG: MAPEG family protein [Gammaproteobacteria bacterium]|nr:MAPEG family protein [Gammaproteobacteria bacterium]